MKNFDGENILNPELIQSALVTVNDKLHSVIDMTLSSITVRDSEMHQSNVTNEEWRPIFFDDLWASQLLGQQRKIINCRTKIDWVLKKCGHYHYLTIFSENSDNKNPVIPIHFVHELQEWYYRLTETNLKYDLSRLPININ